MSFVCILNPTVLIVRSTPITHTHDRPPFTRGISFGPFAVLRKTPRTIPDPNFPGEDEILYFVMVELNFDDIKELKRITALEMQGTLDADGLKAFVEVTQLVVVFIKWIHQTIKLDGANLTPNKMVVTETQFNSTPRAISPN